MMNKSTDSKTTLKFLVSQLLVKRIKSVIIMLIAHNSTLCKRALSRYTLTSVEHRTFTFSAR